MCGAGPAGLAVAGRVAASGLKVALVDPDPLINFIPTYGVWIDEFKAMGFDDCFEWTWEKAVVYLDSDEKGKPIPKYVIEQNSISDSLFFSRPPAPSILILYPRPRSRTQYLGISRARTPA